MDKEDLKRMKGSMRAWIGIDPGKGGAVALIYPNFSHKVFDWPGDATGAARILKEWQALAWIRLAVLESVHAMPKQGVSSTFKFGCNLGQWMGILAALEIPHVMLRPQEWGAGLLKKIDGPDTKSRSLAAARRLFPNASLDRKKDHGRADALLMAWKAKILQEQGRVSHDG